METKNIMVNHFLLSYGGEHEYLVVFEKSINKELLDTTFKYVNALERYAHYESMDIWQTIENICSWTNNTYDCYSLSGEEVPRYEY